MYEHRGAIPLIRHSQLLNQNMKKTSTLSSLSLCTLEIHFTAIEPEPLLIHLTVGELKALV